MTETRGRRFPTDTPEPSPLTRQVRLRAQRTATLWTIDSGTPAENLTGQDLKVGQPVTVQWSPTGHIDQIISANGPSTGGSPVVFVDGRGAVAGVPALGWSMSATGFGDEVKPPVEPPWQDGDDNIEAIAWHPSGRAVAFWTTGEGASVDVYEWLPGGGFGRKYLSMNFADIEAYQTSIGNTVSLPTSGVGAMEFSPNGLFLGIAGTDTGGGATQLQAAVWRFSLTTGVDWLHPLMYYAAFSAAHNGRAFTWAPDGQSVYFGSDDNLAGGDRAQAIEWINDPGAGFGDLIAGYANPDDATAQVTAIAVHPNGEWVATAYLSANGWYVTDEFGGGPDPGPDPIAGDGAAVSWHPSGLHLLAVVENGAQLLAFDPDTGDLSGEVTIDAGPIDSLRGGAFSPDGSLILLIGIIVGGAGIPIARLYTFAGGVATFVAEKRWGLPIPQLPAAVAWEPAA